MKLTRNRRQRSVSSDLRTQINYSLGLLALLHGSWALDGYYANAKRNFTVYRLATDQRFANQWAPCRLR